MVKMAKWSNLMIHGEVVGIIREVRVVRVVRPGSYVFYQRI